MKKNLPETIEKAIIQRRSSQREATWLSMGPLTGSKFSRGCMSEPQEHRETPQTSPCPVAPQANHIRAPKVVLHPENQSPGELAQIQVAGPTPSFCSVGQGGA